MLSWYVGVLGAVLTFAVIPRADAWVLCARPTKAGTFDTTVKIRDVCRRGETQLDPAALAAARGDADTTSRLRAAASAADRVARRARRKSPASERSA